MHLLSLWGRKYGFEWGVIHNKVPPLQTPKKWISPHPNLYVKPHVNNRYIGNFIDKRQEFQGPFRDGL
jgi:hypothetical protein